MQFIVIIIIVIIIIIKDVVCVCVCALRRYSTWGNSWKACRRIHVRLDSFLKSALDGDEWSASSPGHFHVRRESPVPSR